MATSKCIKCDSTTFEMVLDEKTKDAHNQLLFIQCASCGGVVGVLNHRKELLIEAIAKKVGAYI